MKYTILTLALLAAFNANATGNECRGNCTGGSTTHLSQAQSMLQGQTQYNALQVQGATNGAISNTSAGGNSSVNVDNDTKMPASSAIAPSVGTSNNCLIATPASAAVNILFGGVSKTTGFHYSGLCLAYRMNDMALVERLMCLEDKNYAKLNPKCESK